MPYIKPERRDRLDYGDKPRTPGELNYIITQDIMDYINYRNPWTYTDLSDVIAALEGAKLEFYRRMVVPYEEQKREENGDVY